MKLSNISQMEVGFVNIIVVLIKLLFPFINDNDHNSNKYVIIYSFLSKDYLLSSSFLGKINDEDNCRVTYCICCIIN